MGKIREHSKTWMVETSNTGELEIEAVRGVSNIVRLRFPYPHPTTLYVNDLSDYIKALESAHSWLEEEK